MDHESVAKRLIRDARRRAPTPFLVGFIFDNLLDQDVPDIEDQSQVRKAARLILDQEAKDGSRI